MVVSLQTLLDRSNKNMDSGTHEVVRESALEMIKRAYKEGIYVQISEGNRSNARQRQLYNQGRTRPGKVVTNAKPGQSLHNYGTAIDFFIVSDDGQNAIWTVNAKWKRAAAIGKNLGFEWGGDWTSFKDYPHLQMMGGLSLSDLQAGKRPNLTGKVNGKPSTVTKPSSTSWTKVTGSWTGQTLKQGQYGNPVKQLQTKLANNKPPFYPNKDAKNNGVDSYYGDDTRDAVRRYQSYYGLGVDGLAGKATYAKLGGKTVSKPASKPKSKLPTAVYRANKPYPKGTGVKQVQQALASVYFYPNKGAKNNGIDSAYGPDTANAVKRFQSVNGLKADGVYGPATRKKLLAKMK